MPEAIEPQTPDAWSDVMELLFESGWTDGLPVVPPTPRNVQRMLTGTTRQSDALIGRIPPKGGRATVEKIWTRSSTRMRAPRPTTTRRRPVTRTRRPYEARRRNHIPNSIVRT